MPSPISKAIFLLSVALVGAGLAGCSSYRVPGRGANLNLLAARDATTESGQPTDSAENTGRDIELVERKPTASFPAHVAVVRVQEPGYESMTNKGIGAGRYSVVTVRDIETDEDFERLGKLADLAQIAPLSRLLLPSLFESDKELRQAAARLQADMLLVYTVDTSFLDTNKSTVLGLVTLGLGPSVDVRVITTVSALLLDTQTGYIYGTVEETAREQATAGALSTKETCDRLRLKTERQAFHSFLSEFESLWPRVVAANRR
jgi:hypothetical protein